VKLLIDNCVSHQVASALRARGHDVDNVSDWSTDPGDRRVLAEAVRMGRVVITGDREFGELVVFERLPSAGIVILDPDIPAAKHEEACLRAISTHEAELVAGAVVIVMPDRIRIRAADPDA
jgi:predicted nuclease of predicted toxin-antitoxin system